MLVERLLGAEHPDTLSARHNLAFAYQEAGRAADAIAILEPLLSARERLLSAEHPHTLSARNNLALARAGDRTHRGGQSATPRSALMLANGITFRVTMRGGRIGL